MFKTVAHKISSLLGSNTKFKILAAIIVTMVCLVPVSILEQKAYSQSNDFRTDYFSVSVPDGWTQGTSGPVYPQCRDRKCNDVLSP